MAAVAILNLLKCDFRPSDPSYGNIYLRTNLLQLPLLATEIWPKTKSR